MPDQPQSWFLINKRGWIELIRATNRYGVF